MGERNQLDLTVGTSQAIFGGSHFNRLNSRVVRSAELKKKKSGVKVRDGASCEHQHGARQMSGGILSLAVVNWPLWLALMP